MHSVTDIVPTCLCVTYTTHLGLGGDIMGAFNQLYLPQRLTPSGIVLPPLMVLV